MDIRCWIVPNRINSTKPIPFQSTQFNSNTFKYRHGIRISHMTGLAKLHMLHLLFSIRVVGVEMGEGHSECTLAEPVDREVGAPQEIGIAEINRNTVHECKSECQ